MVRLNGLSVDSHISLAKKVTDLGVRGSKQLSAPLTEFKGERKSRSLWEETSSTGFADFLICHTRLDLGTVTDCLKKKEDDNGLVNDHKGDNDYIERADLHNQWVEKKHYHLYE